MLRAGINHDGNEVIKQPFMAPSKHTITLHKSEHKPSSIVDATNSRQNLFLLILTDTLQYIYLRFVVSL